MIMLHWIHVTEAWIRTWVWWGASVSAISVFFLPAILLWPMTLSVRFRDWYGQIVFSVFSRYALFAVIFLNAVYVFREVHGLEGILIVVTASGAVGAAIGLLGLIFVLWGEPTAMVINEETFELVSLDIGTSETKRLFHVIRGGRKH